MNAVVFVAGIPAVSRAVHDARNGGGRVRCDYSLTALVIAAILYVSLMVAYILTVVLDVIAGLAVKFFSFVAKALIKKTFLKV
jgi:hypothetical protein